jgi:hypothetical protein
VEKILYLADNKEKINNNYSNIIQRHSFQNISKQFFGLYDVYEKK